MKKSVGFLALSMLVAGCASKQEQSNKNVDNQNLKKSAEEKSSNDVAEFNKFAANNAFYFDFDKSNVKDQKLVKTYAEKLNKLDNVNVVVSGYCDNKGSAEYNKALGLRRAESVKDVLKNNGVKKDVKVVSYGESKYTKYVSDVALNDSKNRKATIVVE